MEKVSWKNHSQTKLDFKKNKNRKKFGLAILSIQGNSLN